MEKHIRIYILLVVSLFFLLGAHLVSAAQINKTLNFQSKVVYSNGTNVPDGAYDFIFSIYNGPGSGGSSLFTENWTAGSLFQTTLTGAAVTTSADGTVSFGSGLSNCASLKKGQFLTNVTKGESTVIIDAANACSGSVTVAQTPSAWATGNTVTNRIYVKNGIFQVAINSLNQNMTVDFNQDTLFLGINFAGDGEAKPRIQLAAAPYAMNADKVNGLTVTNTTGTLTIPDGKTIAFTGANNLTITTTGDTTATLPSGTVTLVGESSSQTLTNKTIGTSGLTFAGAATDITTGTDENLTIAPNGTGIAQFLTDVELFRAATVSGSLVAGGNVGIGTTSPGSKLHIMAGTSGVTPVSDSNVIIESNAVQYLSMLSNNEQGLVFGTSSSNNGGIYYNNWQNPDGLQLRTGGNNIQMTISASGNVGIGSISPGQKLDVTGNATASGNLMAGGQLQVGRFGAEPTGLGAGAIYYNTSTNKFRCFVNSAWADCSGGSGSPVWSSIQAPSGNLSLAMGTNTTTFNWATGTSTNNLFNLTTDASSNGTGALLNVQTGASSTVYPLHVRAGSTDALTVDANGNVGVGTTSVSASLGVAKTLSTLTDTELSSNKLTIQPATGGDLYTASSINYAYLNNTQALTGGGGKAIISTRNNIRYTGTANVANVYNTYQQVYTDTGSTGVIDTAIGNYSQVGKNAGSGSFAHYYGNLVDNWGNPTIGTAYGFRINDLGNATTNFYGLYLSAQSATGTKYGIYQADTGLNYFAGNMGIGTTTPNTNLSVYNPNENVTQSNFTGSLTNAGINIVTDYTTDAYTPGIFWSSSDNNPTKPKGGIYLQETADGTMMNFGVSNMYNTGLTTTLSLGPDGSVYVKGPIATSNVNWYLESQMDGGGATLFALKKTGETTPKWSFGRSANGGYNSDLFTIFEDDSLANPRLVLAPGGNIGIGTTQPLEKLQVDGNILVNNSSRAYVSVQSSNTIGPELRLLSTDTNGKEYRIGSSGSGNSITAGGFFIFDATSSAMRMVIDTDGNVGFGTTNPNWGRLSVNGGASGAKTLIVRGNSSDNANIQEWQNYAGTALTTINQHGFIDLTGANDAGNTWNMVLKFNGAVVGDSEVTGGFGNGVVKQSGSGRTLFNYIADTSENSIFSGGIDGEHYRRFALSGGGNWQLGPGDGGTDTYMQRSSGGGLKISATIDAPTLTVQGSSGQTANLQEWNINGGSPLAIVSNGGHFETMDASYPGSFATFAEMGAAADYPRTYLTGYSASQPQNYGLYAASANSFGGSDVPAFFGVSTNLDVKKSGSRQLVMYTSPAASGIFTMNTEYADQGAGTSLYLGGSSLTGADAPLWIATNGNVGIGTSEPKEPFHIYSPTTASMRFSNASSDILANDVIGYIDFQAPNDNAGIKARMLALAEGQYTGGSTPTGFAFYTATLDTLVTEKMRLSAAGNLGIGTSAPAAKLDVSGTASVSGSLTLGHNSALQSAYGPLTLNYKSGLDTWAPALTIRDGSGNIGIGTVSPNNPLKIDATAPDVENGSIVRVAGLLNSTSLDQVGLTSTPWVDPPSGSGQTFFGAFFGVNSGSSNLSGSSLVGAHFSNWYSGSGNIYDDYGFEVEHYNIGGSIEYMEGGIFMNPNNSGGGTIQNNTGIWISAQTAGTNNAGLVIGEATGTKSTDLLIGTTTQPSGNYAIYNASALNNYFAGNLGIGSTSPGQKLDVTGNATVSGNLMAGGQLQVGRFGAEPAGLGKGSIYYNTTTNKFRCFINSSWADCDTTGGTGSPVWSSIQAPAGDLSLSMSTYLTSLNWATGTGANNLFNLTTDASADGTGYLMNVATGTSSTVKPLLVKAGIETAISVDELGRVGIGADPDTTAKLYVRGTPHGGTSINGLYNFQTIYSGTSSYASYSGVSNYIVDNDNTSTGHMGYGTYDEYDLYGQADTIMGSSALTRAMSGSTANSLIGLTAGASNLSGGTIATLYGVYGSAITSGSGSVATNAYGIYSSVGNYGGSIGTGYGLYIDAVAGTTHYGVYQAGTTDNNYFAGNVGIGTSQPAYPLELTGVAPDIDKGSIFKMGGTLSSATQNQNGFKFSPYVDPSGASSKTYTGGYFGLNAESSYLDNATLTGAHFSNWYGGTGTVGYMIGFETEHYVGASGGHVGMMYGGKINNPEVTAGATVDNNYGLYIDAQTGAVNNVGLAIREATGTKNTNLLVGTATIPTGSYSIYNASSDNNYFAGNLGIGSTAPTAKLDIAGNASFSGNLAINVPAGSNAATSIDTYNGASINFRTSPGGDEGAVSRLFIGSNGNIGVGSTAPKEKIDVAGNLMINSQANQTAAAYTALNGTLGTFGSQTNVMGATSSAVFRGKLFVATRTSNASAGIYRYDAGTGWTLVTNAAGKIISGDGGVINSIVLVVHNNRLYAGTSTGVGGNAGALYVSTDADGFSPTWSLVSATRGTFGATTNVDGVSSMVSWNGSIYLMTREPNLAALYRYDSGNTFTMLSNAAGKIVSGDTADADEGVLALYMGHLWIGIATSQLTGRVFSYDGGAIANAILVNSARGTFGSETAVPDVYSMAVANGQLYIATKFKNAANIYAVMGTDVSITSNNFKKINSATGNINSGDGTNISQIMLGEYNNRLYAGSGYAAGTAGVYEYDPINGVFNLVNSARGTFYAGNTAVDEVSLLTSFNGNLYVGTTDYTTYGSVYSWYKTTNSSYALKFNAGTSTNSASIVFNESQSALDGSQGSFVFDHIVSLQTGAFDYAEDYATLDSTIDAGDVVAVDRLNPEFVVKANRALPAIGVVSEKPGFRLQQSAENANGNRYIPIALVGRVPVKVSTENGSIKAGDYLTMSANEGIAMKATKAGAVIGQAMEGFDGTSIGKVMIYVQSGQFNGTGIVSALAGLSIDTDKTATADPDRIVYGQRLLTELMKNKDTIDLENMSQINTDHLTVGLEIVTPRIIANDIISNSLTINRVASGSAAVTIDGFGNASFSGTLTADTVRANHIEGLEIVTDSLKTMKLAASDREASISATQKNLSDLAGRVTTLEGQALTATASMTTAEGTTTLSSTLHVKGDSIFDGLISAINKLVTQNLVVMKVAEFFDKTIFHKDTVFEGRTTFNSDTGGSIVMKKGTQSVDIHFNHEFESIPLITISFTGDNAANVQEVLSENYMYIIINRTTKGFTIVLNKQAERDVSLSWIALQVQDAKTTYSDAPTPIPLTPIPLTPSPLTPSVLPTGEISATPVPTITEPPAVASSEAGI